MTSHRVFEAARVCAWSPREPLMVPEEKADPLSLSLTIL